MYKYPYLVTGGKLRIFSTTQLRDLFHYFNGCAITDLGDISASECICDVIDTEEKVKGFFS